jgi:hypothetical protein
VIVVIGSVTYLETAAGSAAGGMAAAIARTAAGAGQSVQFVGKVGEDDAGDAVVLALAEGAIGHVALLREAGFPTSHGRADHDGLPDLDDDGAPPVPAALGATGGGPLLEAADVDLALRYLTNFGVLVLVGATDDATTRVVGDAAAWAGARLVVVVPLGAAVPDGLPADAIVFEAPDGDPDGVFAGMVGAFAAALDDGDDPGEAFRSTVAAEGWTAAEDAAGQETDASETDPA